MHPRLLIAGLLTVVAGCSTAPSPSAPAASPAAAPAPAAAPLTRAAAGNADAGREAFGADCRGCHGGMIAPPLRGVAGRKIASESSYTGYSDALKARAGETWTDANLDAFLTSPSAFAPGTKMGLPVPDAAKRADIIAFLKTLSAPT